MKNTTELIQKFDSGKTLSTVELESLAQGLKQVIDTLSGKGLMFKAVYDMSNYKFQNVKSVILARKEVTNEKHFTTKKH